MSTVRFCAVAGALILHVIVLLWIATRPAGSISRQADPVFPPALTVALVPAQQDKPALTPLAIRDEQIPAKQPKKVQPALEATNRDIRQPGLIPDYYPAKELSRMPVALTDLDALQSAMAMENVHGKLNIRLWLSESGQIDRIAIVDSDFPEEIQNSMLASFRKMQFKPGELNSNPVKSWVDIVIEYGDNASR